MKGQKMLSHVGKFAVSSIFVFFTIWFIPHSYAITATIVSSRFVININGTEVRFPYCSSHPIDLANANLKRLIISVHGSGPIAQTYLESAKTAATMKNAENETLIIAPQFFDDGEFQEPIPTDLLYWGTSQWGSQTAFIGPDKKSVQISSFAVLDMLLKHVIGSSRFPNIRTIVVLGHSAGGQMVNRYAASNLFETDIAKPKGIVMKYLVMAPSSYLYMDKERVKQNMVSQFEIPSDTYLNGCTGYNNYGYGLDNLYAYHAQNGIDAERIRTQYQYRNVLYLVGSKDNDPNDTANTLLDTSCKAIFQGSQRLERATVFYEYLKHYYGLQIVNNQEFKVVQGVGHVGRDLMTSEEALKFIFPESVSPFMWIGDSSGNLGTVDVITGSVHVIGNMGQTMTDIAFDRNGNLYGITFDSLYSINKTTAASRFIGNIGISANSLVFDSDGTLYTANSSLYKVNVATGVATFVGNGGDSYDSSGDLAFIDGNLLLSSGGYNNNNLIRLDKSTGVGTIIGNIGLGSVYGIATDNHADLYGASGTSVIRINTETGIGIEIAKYGGQGLEDAWGTAFSTESGNYIGDVNGIGGVDLADAILACGFLQALP